MLFTKTLLPYYREFQSCSPVGSKANSGGVRFNGDPQLQAKVKNNGAKTKGGDSTSSVNAAEAAVLGLYIYINDFLHQQKPAAAV